MIPYYFTGMPWKDYLQSRVTIQGVDYSLRTVGSRISGDVGRSGKAITYALAESTKQIVASDREIADTLQRGFSGLEQKLGSINQTLGDVRASIEDFHAAFNYGIGLVLDQLVLQNGTLEQISETLYGIKETLSTPIQTRAQELFTIGCSALSKGLLDKAADYFQKAVTEYDLHLLAHFNLGKLYLYGKDDENDLIDVPKAEEALRAALKLAKAEARVNTKANKLVAETLFHLSMSCYLQAHCYLPAEGQKDSAEKLEEALNFALEASVRNPQFSEAYYQAAKCSSMLEDTADKEKYLRICLDNLDIALYYDPNYAIKVALDGDFDGVRGAVDILLRNKRDSLLEQAVSLTSKISETLQPYKRIPRRVNTVEIDKMYDTFSKLNEFAELCYRVAIDHKKVGNFFRIPFFLLFCPPEDGFHSGKHSRKEFEYEYTWRYDILVEVQRNILNAAPLEINLTSPTYFYLVGVISSIKKSTDILVSSISPNGWGGVFSQGYYNAQSFIECQEKMEQKLALIERRQREKRCLVCGGKISAWKRFNGHTLVCC